MFKNTVPDNVKFWRYFAILILSGSMLFIFGALLYKPLKDLVIALNSNESVPFVVWLFSAGLAAVFGVFWLSFYILFEAAKKGVIDLMFKR